MAEFDEIDEKIPEEGTRLDQRTKLSLMAAIIYSTSEANNVKNIREASEMAFQIDREVADKIRRMKYMRRNAQFRQNQKPITPEGELSEIPRRS